MRVTKVRFAALGVGAVAALILARRAPDPPTERSGALSTMTVRARPLGDGRVRFTIEAPIVAPLPEPTTLSFRGTTIESTSRGTIVGTEQVELRGERTHLSLELLTRPTLIHHAFGHRTALVPWLDDLATYQRAADGIETQTFMLDALPNYSNGGQGPRCGPAFMRPRECRELGYYPPRRWFIAVARADDALLGMIIALGAAGLTFALASRAAYRREVALHGDVVEKVVATDYRGTAVERTRVASRQVQRRFALRVAFTAAMLAASVYAVARYADGRSPIPMQWLVVLVAAVATLVACASLFSATFRAVRPVVILPVLVSYYVLPDAWMALAVAPLALAGVVELFAGNAKVRRPNE